MLQPFSRNLPNVLLIASLSACTHLDMVQQRAPAEPFIVTEAIAPAPFGEKVSTAITNYSRAAPYIGLAGELAPEGVAEAKALGFKLMIDLRQPDEEGVAAEESAAKDAGIEYIRIPLGKTTEAWDQIDQISDLFENRAAFPILMHCGSANRASAAWALYRAKSGITPMTSIEEGRAFGLTSRESFVRELLGLPPIDED